jgi:hypothetical protein
LYLYCPLPVPLLQVKGIIVDQCRVMESKKKPLWLTLKNCDPAGENIVLMLKVCIYVCVCMYVCMCVCMCMCV